MIGSFLIPKTDHAVPRLQGASAIGHLAQDSRVEAGALTGADRAANA